MYLMISKILRQAQTRFAQRHVLQSTTTLRLGLGAELARALPSRSGHFKAEKRRDVKH